MESVPTIYDVLGTGLVSPIRQRNLEVGTGLLIVYAGRRLEG